MSKLRTRKTSLSIGWNDFWPLLLALTLSLFAFRPLMEWWEISELLDRGVSVPAQITSTTIDASGRFSVDVCRYEFLLRDGITRSSGVERYRHGIMPDLDPGELSRKFSQGAVNARYLSDNPRVHRLDLGLPQRMSRSRWFALLLLAAAVITGTFSVVLLVRRRTTR